jgi:uncharacterized protein (DUF1330 family)
MAKGYLVVELEITDQAAYDRYKEAASPLVPGWGGQVLAANGRTQSLEGGWTPPGFVMVEFPSFQAASDFYHSRDYQEHLQLRLASTRSRAFLIEGI